MEACFAYGWSDGLPVVPATEEAVWRCVEATGREAGEVVLSEPVRRRAITLEKVAVKTPRSTATGCSSSWPRR